jgi:hypothetical protein
MQMQKPWDRSRAARSRATETRDERTKILVVCEGQKTEPNYFNAFPVDKEVVVLEVSGSGANTDTLVLEAGSLRQAAIDRKQPYNQVWCVFDRDAFPPDRTNRAFDLASQRKIRIAFSNQSFELWYVLHFNFHDTPQTRQRYVEMLSRYMERTYQKNDTEMYAALLSRQPVAIRNAKTLLGRYCPPRPEQDDPSTTVHLLVEELNRFLAVAAE